MFRTAKISTPFVILVSVLIIAAVFIGINYYSKNIAGEASRLLEGEELSEVTSFPMENIDCSLYNNKGQCEQDRNNDGVADCIWKEALIKDAKAGGGTLSVGSDRCVLNLGDLKYGKLSLASVIMADNCDSSDFLNEYVSNNLYAEIGETSYGLGGICYGNTTLWKFICLKYISEDYIKKNGTGLLAKYYDKNKHGDYIGHFSYECSYGCEMSNNSARCKRAPGDTCVPYCDFIDECSQQIPDSCGGYCLRYTEGRICMNGGGSCINGKCCAPAPDNGNVLWLKFDGDVIDSSGKGNNGNIVGNLTFTSGKYGQALNFSSNTNNKYVKVNNSPTLNLTTNLTIMAWVKTITNSNSWDRIISKSMGGCPLYINNSPVYESYGLVINNCNNANCTMTFQSTIRYNNGSVNGAAVWGATTLKPDTWYHVVGVFNGTHRLVYVNGVLDGSQPVPGSIIPSSNPLTVGISYNGCNEPFTGIIDDVRVYNRALNSSEILLAYQNKDIPPPLICS
ncbi:MAG: LamG domain-containing protein [Candidatus Woesearchaeota archaeon]